MFNSPDRFTLCRTVTKEDVETAWMQSKALITNVIVFVYTFHCFVDNTRYIYVCALIYYLQCTFDIIKRKKDEKKIPNKLAIPNDSFGLYFLLILGKTVVVFCALGFGFHQSDDYDDDDD